MANPMSGTKDFGHGTADKLKETAGQAAEKAKSVASQVGDAVSNAASATATAASSTAEKLTTAAGSGVKHLGETIREKGPKEGVMGGATRAVGNTLEEGGKYLEQEGFSGMMDDVTDLIRRNPVPAVLVGIGIGFLIGRTLGS
jgi:ElaB/YqjD/DUF883 family membrane-anchored ribosome-binding protein